MGPMLLAWIPLATAGLGPADEMVLSDGGVPESVAVAQAALPDQILYWKNLYLGDPLMAPWAEHSEVQAPERWPAGQAVELAASHGEGIAELRVFVDGARVQTLPGEQPSFIPTGGIGETQEVLLVAVAQDPVWQIPGWANAETRVAPRRSGPVVRDLAPGGTGGPGLWRHRSGADSGLWGLRGLGRRAVDAGLGGPARVPPR